MKSHEGGSSVHVHLHVHSEWSNLEKVPSSGSVKEHVIAQFEHNYPVASISDSKYFFGLSEQIRVAGELGIKNRFGVELEFEDGHVLVYPRNTQSFLDFTSTYDPKKRLSYNDLEKLSKGATLILQGNNDRADQVIYRQQYVDFLRSTDNAFHGVIGPGQRLIKYGKQIEELTGKAVIAHEVRAPSTDQIGLLQAIYKLEGVSISKFLLNQHITRSDADIFTLYNNHLQEIGRTVEIAQDISVDFPIIKQYKADVPEGVDSFDYLSQRVYMQVQKEGITDPALLERIQTELRLINLLNFSDYLLICRDAEEYTAKNYIEHIPLGSGTQSYVLQLLGITKTETEDLDYTRFLNEGRKEDRPDIDFDIDGEFGEEVEDYVVNKYDEATLISSVARLKADGVTAKNDALENPLSDSEIQLVVDANIPIEVRRNPAAVAFAKPIPSYPSERGRIAQTTKQILKANGQVKIDFLMRSDTLRLGKIRRSLESQRITTEIEMNDRRVLNRIFSGDTLGISNLESPHMQNVLRKIGKNSETLDIEDITLALALARINYIGRQRYFSPNYVEESGILENPSAKKVLAKTKGVMIFQGQVQDIAELLAHFDEDWKNNVKKLWDPDTSKDEKEEIVIKLETGFAENNVPENISQEFIAQIQSFGTYAFLTGHSRELATISYKLAYFAEYHSETFWTAVLQSIAEKPESKSIPYSTQSYVTDAIRHGIHFDYPHPREIKKIPEFDGDAMRIGWGLFDIKGRKGETISEQQKIEIYRDVYFGKDLRAAEDEILYELESLGVSFVGEPMRIISEDMYFDPKKDDQWVIGHVEGMKQDGELMYVVFDSGVRLNVTAFAQNMRYHPNIYNEPFWYVRLTRDISNPDRWAIVDQGLIDSYSSS